jgi:OOP family OmpA-OmpF porin
MGAADGSPEIKEAFLVHKSGCLITYANSKGEDNQDFDIVAGMLTAIQSFVRDTFGAGQWSLKRLEFEDRNLLIELGDHIYLAIIYEGRADNKMQSKVERTVDIVQEKFWQQCHDWTGDMDEWAGASDIIKCLFAPDEDGGELADDRKRCELCGSIVEDPEITTCQICGYDLSMFT